MPRLLLILAIALVLYILLRRAGSMPPHKRRAEYIKIGIGAAAIDDEVRNNWRRSAGIGGPDNGDAVYIEMGAVNNTAHRCLREAQSGPDKHSAHARPRPFIIDLQISHSTNLP